MSEENKAPSVERNGVVKQFVTKMFGKKSKNFGKSFSTPELDLSVPEDVTWFGLADLNKVVNNWLRVTFMGIHVDSIDDKPGSPTLGQFLADKWQSAAEEFTKGVQKLSDLNAELVEQQDIQSAYVDEMTEASEAGDMEKVQETLAKMKPLGEYIKSLKASIADIKEVYQIRLLKKQENAAKTPTAEKAAA